MFVSLGFRHISFEIFQIDQISGDCSNIFLQSIPHVLKPSITTPNGSPVLSISGPHDHIHHGANAAQEITVVLGVTREAVKSAKAGDIVSISVTGFMPRWTQTLVSHAKVRGIFGCGMLWLWEGMLRHAKARPNWDADPVTLRSIGIEFYDVSGDAKEKAHNLVIGSDR